MSADREVKNTSLLPEQVLQSESALILEIVDQHEAPLLSSGLKFLGIETRVYLKCSK